MATMAGNYRIYQANKAVRAMEAAMTEAQIENTVERRMDRLDAKYLSGAITEEQYQAEIRRIDVWARDMRKLSCLAEKTNILNAG